MKGIADTGLVVAFGNRDDRYHTWAVEMLPEPSPNRY